MRKAIGCLLILLLLLVGSPITPLAAQDQQPFQAGQAVLVMASKAPIYLTPDGSSTSVRDILGGTQTYFLKAQTDKQGAVWLYLMSDAYGWVQATIDGKPTVVASTDAVINEQIAIQSQALKADPSSVTAYITRAALHSAQFDYGAAVLDYSQVIQLSPNDGLLYELRGTAYLDSHDYNDALNDLLNAVKLGQKTVSTYNLLGIANEDLQQYDDALNYYNQAINAAPQFGLVYENRGNIYKDEQQYDQALEAYHQALQLDPLLASVYRQESKIYYDQRQYDQFMTAINQALQINPLYSNAYVDIGVYYATVKGDEKTAFTEFDKAVQVDPRNANALANRAIGFANTTGDMQRALGDLENAAKFAPSDSYVNFTFGAIAARMGDYEEALKAYAVPIQNGDHYGASAQLYRPQVNIALGQYDMALQDTEQWIANINPTYDTADFIALEYIVDATAHLYKGDYSQAADSYQKAVQTNSSFVSSYATAGEGYRVTTRRQMLIGELQYKIYNTPSDTASILALGNLYMELGRWQDGLQTYTSYLRVANDPALSAMVKQLESILR